MAIRADQSGVDTYQGFLYFPIKLLNRSRLCVMSSDQSLSLSTMVGFSRMISSRFSLLWLVWPNTDLGKPGNPELSLDAAWRIKPPIATIWPSRARTMLSVSETELEASGKLSEPAEVPRSTTLVTVLTWLTEGCTCKMISPFSLILGVTSNAIPEKN